MPKLAKRLTDAAARNARPKNCAYSLASGNGLSLEILPSGTKQWLLRYTLQDNTRKKKVIALYPDVGVAAAHTLADELNRAVRSGQPVLGLRDQKRRAKQVLTDEELAAEARAKDAYEHSFLLLSDKWLESSKEEWAPTTYKKYVFIVQDRLQPEIGLMDMRTMRTKDVRPVLLALKSKTPSIASKAVTCLHGVVQHCINEGIREDDQILRLNGIGSRKPKRHLPAVTRIQGVGEVVRAIRAYPSRVVRNALMFSLWTGQRPSNIASAHWDEIDLTLNEWHVPAEKMKMEIDHVVPLPRQAMEMLNEMRMFTNDYVFPAVGKLANTHVHRDALSRALRIMGFQGIHTPHGSRATMRTLARERLKIERDVLESQLAHAKADEIQAAYDRAMHLEERREAVQKWADLLDEQASQ